MMKDDNPPSNKRGEVVNAIRCHSVATTPKVYPKASAKSQIHKGTNSQDIIDDIQGEGSGSLFGSKNHYKMPGP